MRCPNGTWFSSQHMPSDDGAKCLACGLALVDSKRLTGGQRRYLLDLLRGEPVDGHCRSRSDYGGLNTVHYSLIRRGLVEGGRGDAALTPEGRKAAEQLAAT